MDTLESPFLTPQEVAAVLRLSLPTVFRRLREGSIPGFLIGRKWRIRKDQIESFGLSEVKSPNGPEATTK